MINRPDRPYPIRRAGTCHPHLCGLVNASFASCEAREEEEEVGKKK